MITCPNKNLPEWKKLVASQSEPIAYYLWNKFQGNVPSQYYNDSPIYIKLNKSRRKSPFYLKTDQAKKIDLANINEIQISSKFKTIYDKLASKYKTLVTGRFLMDGLITESNSVISVFNVDDNFVDEIKNIDDVIEFNDLGSKVKITLKSSNVIVSDEIVPDYAVLDTANITTVSELVEQLNKLRLTNKVVIKPSQLFSTEIINDILASLNLNSEITIVGYKSSYEEALDYDFKTETRLSINAVSVDLQNNVIYDPFNGIKDQTNGVISVVDIDLLNNPKTVMDLLNAQAHYGFLIGKKTHKALMQLEYLDSLNIIPAFIEMINSTKYPTKLIDSITTYFKSNPISKYLESLKYEIEERFTSLNDDKLEELKQALSNLMHHFQHTELNPIQSVPTTNNSYFDIVKSILNIPIDSPALLAKIITNQEVPYDYSFVEDVQNALNNLDEDSYHKLLNNLYKSLVYTNSALAFSLAPMIKSLEAKHNKYYLDDNESVKINISINSAEEQKIKININEELTELIMPVLKELNDLNKPTLIVGGAVRDALLGVKPKDIDIEVYNTSIDELEQILSKYGKVDQVGKAFGILKFIPYKSTQKEIAESLATATEMVMKSVAVRQNLPLHEVALNNKIESSLRNPLSLESIVSTFADLEEGDYDQITVLNQASEYVIPNKYVKANLIDPDDVWTAKLLDSEPSLLSIKPYIDPETGNKLSLKESLKRAIEEKYNKLIEELNGGNYFISHLSDSYLEKYMNILKNENKLILLSGLMGPNKERFVESIINDKKRLQEKDIKNWLKGLSDNDYNPAFKYLMLKSVLTKHVLKNDSNTVSIINRNRSTVRSFQSFNSDALNKLYASGPDSGQMIVSYYNKMLEVERESLPEENTYAVTDAGVWYVFTEGDHDKLTNIIQDTSWCIKETSVAEMYLSKGLIFVFYPNNPDANEKLAIALKGDKVKEIRGNLHGQDIKQTSYSIIDSFINEYLSDEYKDSKGEKQIEYLKLRAQYLERKNDLNYLKEVIEKSKNSNFFVTDEIAEEAIKQYYTIYVKENEDEILRLANGKRIIKTLVPVSEMVLKFMGAISIIEKHDGSLTAVTTVGTEFHFENLLSVYNLATSNLITNGNSEEQTRSVINNNKTEFYKILRDDYNLNDDNDIELLYEMLSNDNFYVNFTNINADNFLIVKSVPYNGDKIIYNEYNGTSLFRNLNYTIRFTKPVSFKFSEFTKVIFDSNVTNTTVSIDNKILSRSHSTKEKDEDIKWFTRPLEYKPKLYGDLYLFWRSLPADNDARNDFNKILDNTDIEAKFDISKNKILVPIINSKLQREIVSNNLNPNNIQTIKNEIYINSEFDFNNLDLILNLLNNNTNDATICITNPNLIAGNPSNPDSNLSKFFKFFDNLTKTHPDIMIVFSTVENMNAAHKYLKYIEKNLTNKNAEIIITNSNTHKIDFDNTDKLGEDIANGLPSAMVFDNFNVIYNLSDRGYNIKLSLLLEKNTNNFYGFTTKILVGLDLRTKEYERTFNLDISGDLYDKVIPTPPMEFNENDDKLSKIKSSNILDQSHDEVIKGQFVRINDHKSLILLHKDADVSTVLHELAHLWEVNLTEEERQQVLRWAGHTEWSVETSERFAKGFEQYVYFGVKTGNQYIDNLFSKFSKWLNNLIKNFVEYFGYEELNDEIKAIYNKMLTDGLVSKEKLDPDYRISLVELFNNYLLGNLELEGTSRELVEIEEPFDFSVPRRENKVGAGYTGFAVEFSKDITIKEAASRRDFTWNSLGYNPVTQVLYDYYNGIQDLKDGIIRHVSEKFAEDPLRILRAMQFQARYGHIIADETYELMRFIISQGEFDHLVNEKTYNQWLQEKQKLIKLEKEGKLTPELKAKYDQIVGKIPKERIITEWLKWAEKGKYHSKIFEFLRNSGLGDLLYPELMQLVDIAQDPELYPEGNAEESVKQALSRIQELVQNKTIPVNKVFTSKEFYEYLLDSDEEIKQAIYKKLNVTDITPEVKAKAVQIYKAFKQQVNSSSEVDFNNWYDFNVNLSPDEVFYDQNDYDPNFGFDKLLFEALKTKLQQLYPILELNIENDPKWDYGDEVYYSRLIEEKFKETKAALEKVFFTTVILDNTIKEDFQLSGNVIKLSNKALNTPLSHLITVMIYNNYIPNNMKKELNKLPDKGMSLIHDIIHERINNRIPKNFNFEFVVKMKDIVSPVLYKIAEAIMDSSIDVKSKDFKDIFVVTHELKNKSLKDLIATLATKKLAFQPPVTVIPYDTLVVRKITELHKNVNSSEIAKQLIVPDISVVYIDDIPFREIKIHLPEYMKPLFYNYFKSEFYDTPDKYAIYDTLKEEFKKYYKDVGFYDAENILDEIIIFLKDEVNLRIYSNPPKPGLVISPNDYDIHKLILNDVIKFVGPFANVYKFVNGEAYKYSKPFATVREIENLGLSNIKGVKRKFEVVHNVGSYTRYSVEEIIDFWKTLRNGKFDIMSTFIDFKDKPISAAPRNYKIPGSFRIVLKPETELFAYYGDDAFTKRVASLNESRDRNKFITYEDHIVSSLAVNYEYFKNIKDTLKHEILTNTSGYEELLVRFQPQFIKKLDYYAEFERDYLYDSYTTRVVNSLLELKNLYGFELNLYVIDPARVGIKNEYRLYKKYPATSKTISTYNQVVDQRILGQANIKALSVLIDAVNQKQDTLPHEYAHHYIAWFRHTELVQQAIKKWGSEEELVRQIGLQAVKQKGEAWNWWNKFVKWIMNKFNLISDLDKRALRNILTDAFLKGIDLDTNETLTTNRMIELASRAADKDVLKSKKLNLITDETINQAKEGNVNAQYNLVAQAINDMYLNPEISQSSAFKALYLIHNYPQTISLITNHIPDLLSTLSNANLNQLYDNSEFKDSVTKEELINALDQIKNGYDNYKNIVSSMVRPPKMIIENEVVDNIEITPEDKIPLVFAALLHNIGKVKTSKQLKVEDGYVIDDSGYSSESVKLASQFLTNISMYNTHTQKILKLIETHQLHQNISNTNDYKTKLSEVGKQITKLGPVSPNQLLALSTAIGSDKTKYNTKPSVSVIELYNLINDFKSLNQGKLELVQLVNADMLVKQGIKPGKQFGQIINAAKEAQLNLEFTTKEGAEIWLNNYLANNPITQETTKVLFTKETSDNIVKTYQNMIKNVLNNTVVVNKLDLIKIDDQNNIC